MISSKMVRVVRAPEHLIRVFSQSAAPSSSGTQGKPASPPDPLSKVSGLTTNVVLKPESGKKVGPGASHDADYKVPEYFLYGRHSYHEAEIELAPFRCPQPSALKNYVPRLPKVGETIHGSRFSTGYGGKGANQCVAASRLGSQCSMVGKVGQDSWGQAYRSHLEGEGIDITHLSVIDGQSTGVAQISVCESNGANHIVIVVGANNFLTVQDAESAAQRFSSARVLICQLETPIDATIRALELFKGASIFNAAPALKETPQKLLQLPTILCVNESEASLITNLPVESAQEAKEAIGVLQKMGANTVIITLGADGAVFREKASTETIHVRIDPVDRVVDTTGAGDAFIGALAHLLAKLETQEVPFGQLVGAACEIASMSVKLPGTQSSFPKISEFEKQVLNKNYNLEEI